VPALAHAVSSASGERERRPPFQPRSIEHLPCTPPHSRHDRSAIMGPCWAARAACISVVVSQLYLTGIDAPGRLLSSERTCISPPCPRLFHFSSSSLLVVTECEAHGLETGRHKLVTQRRLHCLPGLTDDLFRHDECVGCGVERQLREHLETGHGGHATRLWACRCDCSTVRERI